MTNKEKLKKTGTEANLIIDSDEAYLEHLEMNDYDDYEKYKDNTKSEEFQEKKKRFFH